MTPTPANIDAILDFHDYDEQVMAGILDVIALRMGPPELFEHMLFARIWRRAGLARCTEAWEAYQSATPMFSEVGL